MMTLVNQPSALPTNKLAVAALIGPAVTEAWPGVLDLLAPAYAGPLEGPAVSALVGAVAALAVGWWVKDRANT